MANCWSDSLMAFEISIFEYITKILIALTGREKKYNLHKGKIYSENKSQSNFCTFIKTLDITYLKLPLYQNFSKKWYMYMWIIVCIYP